MTQCKILFLAANPEGTSQLALDKEIREIDAKIRAADFRDSLQLVSHWAVRPDDLLQFLNQHKPHVVHFSGHGSEENEILLLSDTGNSQPVSSAALRELFRTLKDNIRVVVFNACFSHGQAEAIVENIDCAVGMNKAIGDQAAITFAASFYRALGFGRSVQQAFDQGKTALMLAGIREENTPELLCRSGVDPNDIVLVQAQTLANKPDSGKETVMSDESNRGVSIGGNVTGSAIVTGDHNVTSLQFTQTTLPPAETIDVQAEFAALRQILTGLQAADQKKIDRALEDAADEITKPEPDRDEIGQALDRALTYATKAESFAATAGKLQTHITNTVSWLGDNWHKLLALVGLTL
jgi:hypothetical protein